MEAAWNTAKDTHTAAVKEWKKACEELTRQKVPKKNHLKAPVRPRKADITAAIQVEHEEEQSDESSSSSSESDGE
ncbi:hypothetical protein EW146_g9651 [Bondarzewia mesenterica]|uniref:Uncharacterized protein n=1 Tax=Bondarzewia mesenterica TaxID=1095465 RepID=A0A4S4L4G0_9AGAM|nr:hypothetical protein EW146_g9651 [Bondarzewia mesenterica]